MLAALQSPQLLFLQARSIGIDFKTECLRSQILKLSVDQSNLKNRAIYYNPFNYRTINLLLITVIISRKRWKNGLRIDDANPRIIPLPEHLHGIDKLVIPH